MSLMGLLGTSFQGLGVVLVGHPCDDVSYSDLVEEIIKVFLLETNNLVSPSLVLNGFVWSFEFEHLLGVVLEDLIDEPVVIGGFKVGVWILFAEVLTNGEDKFAAVACQVFVIMLQRLKLVLESFEMAVSSNPRVCSKRMDAAKSYLSGVDSYPKNLFNLQEVIGFSGMVLSQSSKITIAMVVKAADFSLSRDVGLDFSPMCLLGDIQVLQAKIDVCFFDSYVLLFGSLKLRMDRMEAEMDFSDVFYLEEAFSGTTQVNVANLAWARISNSKIYLISNFIGILLCSLFLEVDSVNFFGVMGFDVVFEVLGPRLRNFIIATDLVMSPNSVPSSWVGLSEPFSGLLNVLRNSLIGMSKGTFISLKDASSQLGLLVLFEGAGVNKLLIDVGLKAVVLNGYQVCSKLNANLKNEHQRFVVSPENRVTTVGNCFERKHNQLNYCSGNCDCWLLFMVETITYKGLWEAYYGHKAGQEVDS